MGWIRGHPRGVIVSAGVVMAITLFASTSGRAPDAPADFTYQNAFGRPGGVGLSPYAQDIEPSAFDPWTGEPHGWRYWSNPHGIGERTDSAGPTPADLVGRRAIPLPAGFVLGALLGAVLVLAAGDTRNRSASDDAARDRSLGVRRGDRSDEGPQ